MIYLIAWPIVGALIGWIASQIMRTDDQQSVILNVVVGVVGAAIGGWLLSPMLGTPSISDSAFNLTSVLVALISVLVSLAAAVVLLAIATLFRRGHPR